MQKLLPKTIKNPQGFTLIELLVVITIIAVLAVMGFAVFSGLAGRGNDARRRADLKSISDTMEVTRAGTTGSVYVSIAATGFSGGAFPAEPNATSHQAYCYLDSTANPAVQVANPTLAGAWTANGCGGTGGWKPVGATMVTANATSYRVCGVLDDNTTIVCFGSRQ